MSKFWDRRRVGPIKAIHPMTHRVIEVNPQADAMIGSDLDREMTRLPGLVSWYMALRDTAEAAYREAKHAEHNCEEDIYAELRAQPQKGTKRTTETEMKNAVKADERMRAAFRDRMDAEAMLRNLRSAVEAMIEKRWTLQSLTKWRLSEGSVRDST